MLRSVKLVILIVLVSACGGQTALPKGPAPEYEDEPVVAAPVVADAGVE